MAGFDFVTVKSTPAGFVDMADLEHKLDEQTAVFMITNPNTLGMFDRHIADIAARCIKRAAWFISTGRT